MDDLSTWSNLKVQVEARGGAAVEDATEAEVARGILVLGNNDRNKEEEGNVVGLQRRPPLVVREKTN